MEHAPRAPRDLLRVALARVPRYCHDERRPPEAKVRRRRRQDHRVLVRLQEALLRRSRVEPRADGEVVRDREGLHGSYESLRRRRGVRRRRELNYASTLIALERFEEAKSLMRKMLPVARRVLGESNDIAIITRWNYARALYEDPAATHGDLHEAVNTLEETERTARRVLSSAHPITVGVERNLRNAQDALREREASSGMATRTRAARARPSG